MFCQVATFDNSEDETVVILSYNASRKRDVSEFKAGLGHNPEPPID